MYIYWLVLIAIILNGMLMGNNRKYFIGSSFFLVTLLAALRKYTVGIDLEVHYADRFSTIAHLPWNQLTTYQKAHTYDFGFIVFDKVLGLISDNPQIFIVVTSIIIYGLVARYIYRHSDNVVLETFMFITSFTMMMYMNIIAQALAIAIILFGLDFLADKKYVKYVFCVLIATTIHTSAIVCIVFIPLLNLPNNKKYIIEYITAVGIGSLFLDKIVTVLIRTVFSEFAPYFEAGSYHGAGINVSANSLFQISMHALALIIAFLFLYKNGKVDESRLRLCSKKKASFLSGKNVVTEIGQLPTSFLMYMSVTACIFRIIVYQSYIFSRMGFYFYFFSFSLLARGVAEIKNKSNKKIITSFLYLYMIFMFLIFYKSAGMNSYGVLPYAFFWD